MNRTKIDESQAIYSPGTGFVSRIASSVAQPPFNLIKVLTDMDQKKRFLLSDIWRERSPSLLFVTASAKSSMP
jgi:hypothetical protein